jgi:hypothetical protein
MPVTTLGPAMENHSSQFCGNRSRVIAKKLAKVSAGLNGGWVYLRPLDLGLVFESPLEGTR